MFVPSLARDNGTGNPSPVPENYVRQYYEAALKPALDEACEFHGYELLNRYQDQRYRNTSVDGTLNATAVVQVADNQLIVFGRLLMEKVRQIRGFEDAFLLHDEAGMKNAHRFIPDGTEQGARDCADVFLRNYDFDNLSPTDVCLVDVGINIAADKHIVMVRKDLLRHVVGLMTSE